MSLSWRGSHMRRQRRRGTTSVEVAIVLPIFLAFVFGVFEFGRLQLVCNLLTSSARAGARLGATEGISTSTAMNHVLSAMAIGVDAGDVSVAVKDASVYDGSGPYPQCLGDFQSLPDVELSGLEARELFLIHTSIPYNEVAILPFPFLRDWTLTGRAVMRHE